MLHDEETIEVEVDREQLLKAMRQNRSKHNEEYREARKGFETRYIAKVEEMLRDARSGKDFEQHVNLPEPEDHTEDYDQAIRMFEMSVHPTVTLTEKQFSQYVMDTWGWQRSFKAVTAGYIGSPRNR